MKKNDTIKKIPDWTSLGYDKNMGKPINEAKPGDFIGGENFDIRLDEMMFNRMIQFKNLSQKPQGNNAAKTYFDPVTKKLYIWIDAVGKWGEILITTTSTTTTSSSTSSTSTSTTSSSTSSTSSSTSTS